MQRAPAILVGAAAILVAGLAVALGSGRMPLGVPGEWEWIRITQMPGLLRILPALFGIAGYAVVAARGLRSLTGPVEPRRSREAGWLAALVVAAVATQGLVQEGAPEGYGLEKWVIALQNKGSSGYLTIARTQMDDPGQFLKDFPSWIARQDALHIGTHPPGLFVVSRLVLDRMQASPSLTKWVVNLAPPSTAAAIRLFRSSHGLSLPEAATITTIAALTLLACSLTVVPLYLLGRALGLSAAMAWVPAALWPLVPSALMFQPTADTAFPLLSTTALALAAWTHSAGRGRALLASLGAGLVLGVGMQFTLAFLPVGLTVGLLLAFRPGPSWQRRVAWIGGTGVGFLAITLGAWAATSANPFAIWWQNQANHARFYVENPRSYGAWVRVNPVELAVGLGLPATLWVVTGLASPRRQPASGTAWIMVAILTFLTLGGRSLSEVSRLWIPFMPTLLVAAGVGFQRLGGGPKTLAASVVLLGVQTLMMEAMFQVVYPV